MKLSAKTQSLSVSIFTSGTRWLNEAGLISAFWSSLAPAKLTDALLMSPLGAPFPLSPTFPLSLLLNI